MAETTLERLRRAYEREMREPMPAERFVPTARLCDLGLTSLEVINWAMEIEDALEITIADAELSSWDTVADVVATVDGLLSVKHQMAEG